MLTIFVGVRLDLMNYICNITLCINVRFTIDKISKLRTNLPSFTVNGRWTIPLPNTIPIVGVRVSRVTCGFVSKAGHRISFESFLSNLSCSSWVKLFDLIKWKYKSTEIMKILNNHFVILLPEPNITSVGHFRNISEHLDLNLATILHFTQYSKLG
jgi:hypothetical protein